MIVITKAGEVYEIVCGASRVHPELIGNEKLDGAFVHTLTLRMKQNIP